MLRELTCVIYWELAVALANVKLMNRYFGTKSLAWWLVFFLHSVKLCFLESLWSHLSFPSGQISENLSKIPEKVPKLHSDSNLCCLIAKELINHVHIHLPKRRNKLSLLRVSSIYISFPKVLIFRELNVWRKEPQKKNNIRNNNKLRIIIFKGNEIFMRTFLLLNNSIELFF